MGTISSLQKPRQERMNDLKDPAYSRAIYPRFGYAMKPSWAKFIKQTGMSDGHLHGDWFRKRHHESLFYVLYLDLSILK